MQMRGRQQVTDPDIRALLQAHGDSLDAFQIIREKATALLKKFGCFEDDSPTPLDRIKAIASVAGLDVRAAAGEMSKGRVAMFVPSGDGTKGYIVYDPSLPPTRVVYSIGHEIVHSFVPSSTSGARFRSTYSPSSKPMRQLELLCEFGAALLTMPDEPFKTAVQRNGFGLESVNAIRRQFGTSFEATTYRMAQTAGFGAAAVKLQYRLSKAQLQTAPSSGSLFPYPDKETVKPKYRCQSFHKSDRFPGLIPFNKSFAEDSCVYQIATGTTAVLRASEIVPVVGGRRVRASVEAICAPYQPPDADPDRPDVLVLIQLLPPQ